uniref:ATP synthase CF0 subunit I n=2 Tax=Sarcopyramis TaxID=1898934 RepID=A0A5P8GJG1_9MYRT|nr:ATP synthase CF0 subunit I [Sarcopyramis bodinieri]QFQ43082.1 ATP synthase CF0 subunit I [Sarcopyramis napalensis]QFQ45182.1 ATP synthase CF0 subunit I [Sarcopyramis napalensis]
MKNLTDSFLSLGQWTMAGRFGFNTDILATNPINLSVVFGVLIFFGKGVCASCLLRGRAIEQLERARARLQKVEMEAEQFRVNGYSGIEQERLNLINSTSKTLEQLENYKNETVLFEQQRAINEVRQRVFQQALQGALGALNSCLNNELHLRTISTNIGLFGAMKEITD